MILDQLAALARTFVLGFFELIPEWTPDLPDFAGMGLTVGGSVGMLEGYFPVSALAVVIVAYLSIRLGLFLWHTAVFVWSVIPFKAT